MSFFRRPENEPVQVAYATNQAEAEKFLDSLKTIDGLEKSYISQVTRVKS